MYKVQRHSCCNATEISEREYLRLAMKEPPDNRFAIFKAEQERLKKVSTERTSKWPNTLVNLRLLREQARLDKIKKEEQDMIKRDKENVSIRHKERLDKIDKANNLLEKPHIKALQSKAWINDVMKERIEQIKLAKIWKDKWMEKEKYYHNEMLESVAKLNQEEEEKTKKAFETNQLLIKEQNKQVEMIHKRVAGEIEEQQREKIRLKKQLEDDEAKENAKLKAKKDKLLASIKEVAEINKSTQGNGTMIVERERKLDEEIAIYWKNRKIWEAGLKKIKDDKVAVKRKREEIMADRLDKLYKTLATKIAGNEEKHRIAKEKAEDEHIVTKEAKAKALLAECHKSRQLQIKTRKEKLEEEKKDVAFEDEFAAKCIQKRIEEEKDEEIKKYNYNRKVAQFCINQKNQRKEADRIAKETALHEDIEALIQLKEDELYLKNLSFD